MHKTILSLKLFIFERKISKISARINFQMCAGPTCMIYD